jgi:hypothetical protein
MEQISVTSLRNNIYQIMDNIIKTGIPLEIERRGHTIKISLDDNKKKDRISKLVPHNTLNCDPEEIINLKVYTWDEGKDL